MQALSVWWPRPIQFLSHTPNSRVPVGGWIITQKKIAALRCDFSVPVAGQKPTLACTKNVRGSPRYRPALLSLERV